MAPMERINADSIELRDAELTVRGLLPSEWHDLKALAQEGYTLPEIASHLDVGVRELAEAARYSPEVYRLLDVLKTHAHAYHARQARGAITDAEGRFSEPAYNATMRNLGEEPKQAVVHVHASMDAETTRQLVDLSAFTERFSQFVQPALPEPEPAVQLTVEDIL